jgi:hypothetical protein
VRKLISSIALCAIILITVGCGGGGEKDKNKDKDVPKTGKADPAG